MSTPTAAIIGGGLAGLSAAAALGEAGFQVDVYEARPHLGGRATSYPVPGAEAELIDNCQHILLGCCVNLLDFYRRLGAARKVQFFDEYFFIEPGGRLSTLRAGGLPAPLHFGPSFLGMKCFSLAEKLAIGRGLLALRGETGRLDLESVTMLDWLREHNQPARAIERFWRQVLVSAVNEELDRMSAAHGFQVFRLGFLAGPRASAMGVPAVPLSELYGREAWSRLPNVRIRTREKIDRALDLRADAIVLAVPWEAAGALAPELALDFEGWEHSPITGIHLWFDRPVTTLPYATLLDRTIQWMFNKAGGRYIQLVVSASRKLSPMPREEVIDLAMRELAEFLPAMRRASLERAHVVKELRATFSVKPGVEVQRPRAVTHVPRLFLAGDWTRTGWPATMEGAVRSGYLAAGAVCESLGRKRNFLLPDVA